VPALRATRIDLNPALKEGSRNLTGGRSRLALNNILVASQIALSLVLLAGAGLMVRTLQNLRHLDPGFDKRNVLLFSVDRGIGLEPTAADAILFKQMPSKFEAVPGILSSTLLVNYGLLGGNSAGLRINNVEGYVPRDDEDMEIAHFSVGAKFFETMGTPLLRGRDFQPNDELANRPVAVINETMAQYFFGDKDPVGRLVWGHEVIGVAKDAKHRSLREHTPRALYVGTVRPFYPGPPGAGIRFAVRTSGNPVDVTPALRDIVKQFDAGFQIRNIETLNDRAEVTLVNERLLVRFAGVFSLMALLLACIGLYGTLSYAVVQRTNEIGVRLALGARRGDVVKTIMVDSARIVGVGLLLGLTGTVAFMRFISNFLFGITPTDSPTVTVAALLLIASAALAAYWPARRASAVDPIIALRHE
jgi:predicted permease